MEIQNLVACELYGIQKLRYKYPAFSFYFYKNCNFWDIYNTRKIWIQNQVFFIFQNTSRTTIFLKNHGHSFLRSIKSIVRSKERRERNMISVRVGTGENCILSPKRARFSVRVNIFVKDIINFHKKGIWDLNLQFLLKQLLKLVWLQKVYSFQNLSATFFPLWELPSPFLTFFKEQLFIKLVTCRIHHFLSLVFGSIFWWVLFEGIFRVLMKWEWNNSYLQTAIF